MHIHCHFVYSAQIVTFTDLKLMLQALWKLVNGGFNFSQILHFHYVLNHSSEEFVLYGLCFPPA